MTVSGETKLYCLIGDPVGHSLSPFLMNRAFAARGINAIYAACPVKAARIEDAIRGMRVLGVQGANVTYPLKELVIRQVDRKSRAVEIIGAANTLVFTDDGIEAHNTDATGTAAALRDIAGVSPAGRHAFIFGAGGSGRAAAYGLLEAGASSVTFGSRDPQKSRNAVERLQHAFPKQPVDVFSLLDGHGPHTLKDTLASADIIINATPIGMLGSEESSWIDDPAHLKKTHCCFEFVYRPGDTRFAATARDAGASVIDGLALLVAQAADGFRLWTGSDFAIVEMYEAARKHAAAIEAQRDGAE